jgi:hypothetical protein
MGTGIEMTIGMEIPIEMEITMGMEIPMVIGIEIGMDIGMRMKIGNMIIGWRIK